MTRGLGDSKDQLQPSGGRLRAVVLDGATLIFAAGKNANESSADHGAKRQVAGQGKQPFAIAGFWEVKKVLTKARIISDFLRIAAKSRN